MKTPNLREQVVFERLTEGDDGFGNTVTGWQAHLTVWADVRETLGKERVDAGRVEDSNTATVRIRNFPASRGLTPADRVVMRGVPWNIRSIVPMGNRGQYLDALCERGVAT